MIDDQKKLFHCTRCSRFKLWSSIWSHPPFPMCVEWGLHLQTKNRAFSHLLHPLQPDARNTTCIHTPSTHEEEPAGPRPQPSWRPARPRRGLPWWRQTLGQHLDLEGQSARSRCRELRHLRPTGPHRRYRSSRQLHATTAYFRATARPACETSQPPLGQLAAASSQTSRDRSWQP